MHLLSQIIVQITSVIDPWAGASFSVSILLGFEDLSYLKHKVFSPDTSHFYSLSYINSLLRRTELNAKS